MNFFLLFALMVFSVSSFATEVPRIPQDSLMCDDKVSLTIAGKRAKIGRGFLDLAKRMKELRLEARIDELLLYVETHANDLTPTEALYLAHIGKFTYRPNVQSDELIVTYLRRQDKIDRENVVRLFSSLTKEKRAIIESAVFRDRPIPIQLLELFPHAHALPILDPLEALREMRPTTRLKALKDWVEDEAEKGSLESHRVTEVSSRYRLLEDTHDRNDFIAYYFDHLDPTRVSSTQIELTLSVIDEDVRGTIAHGFAKRIPPRHQYLDLARAMTMAGSHLYLTTYLDQEFESPFDIVTMKNILSYGQDRFAKMAIAQKLAEQFRLFESLPSFAQFDELRTVAGEPYSADPFSLAYLGQMYERKMPVPRKVLMLTLSGMSSSRQDEGIELALKQYEKEGRIQLETVAMLAKVSLGSAGAGHILIYAENRGIEVIHSYQRRNFQFILDSIGGVEDVRLRKLLVRLGMRHINAEVIPTLKERLPEELRNEQPGR